MFMIFSRSIIALLLIHSLPVSADEGNADKGNVESKWKLAPLTYNNPGLKVDLGVGLWAWPLPMDYDGDGDMDLLVACPDKPSNGVFFSKMERRIQKIRGQYLNQQFDWAKRLTIFRSASSMGNLASSSRDTNFQEIRVPVNLIFQIPLKSTPAPMSMTATCEPTCGDTLITMVTAIKT